MSEQTDDGAERSAELEEGPICDREDCMYPALWRPVLTLYSGESLVGAEAHMDIVVCNFHYNTLTLEDVLGEEAWQQITIAFNKAGLMVPRRERTELKWEELV